MEQTNIFRILWRPAKRPADAAYATLVGEQAYDVKFCQQCERATFSRQLRDLSIELHGLQLMGFVWPDDASMIISDDLAQHLTKFSLKGFELRPVQIVAWWRRNPTTGKDINWLEAHHPPKLFQVVIIGKGGHISTETGVRVVSSCDFCGAKAYLPIDMAQVSLPQWDGSDILTIDEFPNYIFVTDKFVYALSEYESQNYSITSSGVLH